MPLATPDIVVVGHICRDVQPDPPGWRAGGAAFYAAATASRLGCSVGVVTAGAAEVEALRELPNTTVVCLDARCSTSFENVASPAGRRQWLRALAPVISADLLPNEWRTAPLALLAPVAGEVPPALARAFPRALLGVAAQGWLRRLEVGHEVRPAPWEHAPEVLPYAAAVFASDEDLQGAAPGWLGVRGPVMVVTRGADGCELTHGGRTRHVPAFPATEIDATGAGDVFAAAFMLRLRESRDPLDAARYASCVASSAVAGVGAASLPSPDWVRERLEAVPA